jgi:septal ring factor EnvC (AmiA/AmiB activator)
MGFDLEQEDSYAQRRKEYVEHRYRRAQFILADAQTQRRALHNTYGATAAQLAQAGYRVRRAQEQLEDILSTLEFLEDQHCSAMRLSWVG